MRYVDLHSRRPHVLLTAPVHAVVFVNRLDGGNNARANNGVVTLIAPNGTTLSSGLLNSGSVTTINYPNNAVRGPIFPNSSLAPASVASLQTTDLNLNTYVRYLNITSAPGKCLFFREIYAFDDTYTNVALYKPATQGPTATYTDQTFGFVSLPSYGNDGIIDVSSSSVSTASCRA